MIWKFAHFSRFQTRICAAMMAFMATLGLIAQHEQEYGQHSATLLMQPNLEAYLQQAMAENPQLKGFKRRYEAAIQRIPQASALPDPSLQVTHFVESVQTRTGPQENLFMLSQKLPWFGKRSSLEEVASIEAETLWFAYQTQQLLVARKVAVAFFEYGYTKHAIKLTEENRELLTRLEPIVEEKVKSGGELNALLRLKVEIGKADDRLQSLQQKRRLQSSTIGALLNLSGTSVLPWPEWEEPTFVSFELGSASAKLEVNNPELQMLDRTIDSAQARKEIARLKSYPDVTLGVNYIQIGDPVVNPATPDAGNDPWGITVAINLPIWSGKNRAERDESAALEQASRFEYEQRRNSLISQLESSIALLDDANRRLNLYGKELLDLAEQAAENSRSGYQNGRNGILEVIDSERSLLELQLSYWRAAADAWQQRIHIQTLTNQPITQL